MNLIRSCPVANSIDSGCQNGTQRYSLSSYDGHWISAGLLADRPLIRATRIGSEHEFASEAVSLCSVSRTSS